MPVRVGRFLFTWNSAPANLRWTISKWNFANVLHLVYALIKQTRGYTATRHSFVVYICFVFAVAAERFLSTMFHLFVYPSGYCANSGHKPDLSRELKWKERVSWFFAQIIVCSGASNRPRNFGRSPSDSLRCFQLISHCLNGNWFDWKFVIVRQARLWLVSFRLNYRAHTHICTLTLRPTGRSWLS